MIEIQVSCLIVLFYLFIYYVLNFRLKLTEASLYYCSSKVFFFYFFYFYGQAKERTLVNSVKVYMKFGVYNQHCLR